MALLKTYKPKYLGSEDTKYAIAYRSSKDDGQFNCHSHAHTKVKDVLKVRPICNTSGTKLNNLPVIMKLYYNKKGKPNKKVLYYWDNKKQIWKLNNKGVI